jgi:hypothetical protein
MNGSDVVEETSESVIPLPAVKRNKWWRRLKWALLVLFLGGVLLCIVFCVSFIRKFPHEWIWMDDSPAFHETPVLSSDRSWVQEEPLSSKNSPKSVLLDDGVLSAELFPSDGNNENPCCSAEQNGFRTFSHSAYPNHDIFGVSGLNFEHIFSRLSEDWERGEFSPRKVACVLEPHSGNSASLFWPSATSSWGADSKMTYSLNGNGYVDLEFRTSFAKDPEREYLLYMWANYMCGVRSPVTHFWGIKNFSSLTDNFGTGDFGWVTFGAWPLPPLFDEQGIVGFLGAPELWHESRFKNLNFMSYEDCRFLLPFFWGIVDGDGDLSTTNDDMVYAMMFDQAESLRMIMWDFARGEHKPVWDWQYVIQAPKPGCSYGYRARVLYKPYVSPEDVVSEYVQWVKSLDEPKHELKITVDPPESAEVFPAETSGKYGESVRTYFGVNPSPGWKFHHWEGPAEYPNRRYTSVKMDRDAEVRAVCRKK